MAKPARICKKTLVHAAGIPTSDRSVTVRCTPHGFGLRSLPTRHETPNMGLKLGCRHSCNVGSIAFPDVFSRRLGLAYKTRGTCPNHRIAGRYVDLDGVSGAGACALSMTENMPARRAAFNPVAGFSLNRRPAPWSLPERRCVYGKARRGNHRCTPMNADSDALPDAPAPRLRVHWRMSMQRGPIGVHRRASVVSNFFFRC
jgi:hypothetical protein